MLLAESKGLVLRDYRQFWMGHKGDVENRIERWFGILKARTKSFYSNFPNNSTIEGVKTHLETFATRCNTLPKTKT